MMKYDVIIVGGSYAGLSAAMSLGRSLRKVLVVDTGKPCNAPTPHSHNFLTQDGETPAAIASKAKQQVALYNTVEFVNDEALSAAKIPGGFSVILKGAGSMSARKLVFATGIKDELPAISGFSDCWGKTVIHCPYCHGYEFHGRKTAVFSNGETAIHYAILVGNLTSDLEIFTNGPHDFGEEQLAKLKKHNIKVNESKVVAVEHDNGRLTNVVLEGGRKLAFDAMYFRPPFKQHCSIPELLGAELTEQGYLKVDATQKTTVDGVYACGDNSSMMRAVASAVSAGNMTGAAINRELATEDF